MIFRNNLKLLLLISAVLCILPRIQAQPTVTTITLNSVNPTTAASVTWNVTFSEPVSGVTQNAFTLAATGVTATLSTVTAILGNQTWTVPADNVSGDGLLGVNLTNPAGIAGASGALANTLNGESYTVDNTLPQVLSITRLDASPTTATTVNFAVEFSEPVYNVTAINFAPTGLPGSVGAVVPVGDQSIWHVTVSGITGNGTIGIDLSDISGIHDLAGNALASDFTLGELYTIDQQSPALVCITRLDSSPTSATTVHFLVEFDEIVSNVQPANFTVAATGTATGIITTITPATAGTTFTLTVANVNGAGTIGVNLSNPAGIIDTAGNPISGAAPGCESYIIDRVGPTVASIILAEDSPTSASVVHFVVNFSEPVTTAALSDFSVTGSATGTISGVVTNSNITTVTVTGVTGPGSLCLQVNSPSTITDLMGNPLTGIPYSSACYIVCQDFGPVTNLIPADGSTTSTAADYLQWTPPAPGLAFHVYFDGTYIETTTATYAAIPKPLSPGQHSYMIDVDGACTSGTTVYFNVLDAPDLYYPASGYVSCRWPAIFYWEPVDGATTYSVFINSVSEAQTSVTYATIPSQGPGFYQWHVEASNEFGSVQSELSTFTITIDDPVPPVTLKTNGTIYKLVRGNDGTIYAAGEFSAAKSNDGNYYPRSNLAAFSSSTQELLAWSPNINGAIYAMIPYGNNLIIGGDFTQVGSKPRARVAELAMDNSTTEPTAFQPHANDAVRALAVVGSNLYYAGDFTKIGEPVYNFSTPGIDATRMAVASLTATPTIPVAVNLAPNATVRDLYVDGDDMYIAGVFSQIGGESIRGLAKTSVTGLQPQLDASFDLGIDLYAYTVRTIGDVVYFGGSFNSVMGKVRHNAASVLLGDSTTSTTLTPWTPQPNASVEVIATQGNPGGPIYLGGTFTNLNLERAAYLAAVDPYYGYVSSCSFNADRSIQTILPVPEFGMTPTDIFIGGKATETGTMPAPGP